MSAIAVVTTEEEVAPKRARARGARSRGKIAAPLLFLTPFLLLFAVFILIPIGYSIYISLFSVSTSGLGLSGATSQHFVGLHNYGTALTDPAFRSGVLRVLLFGVVQIPVMLGLALTCALLLDWGRVKLRRFFRLAFFLPYGIPGVLAAILWGFLYVPGISPIVSILGHTPVGQVDFLGQNLALWSIANIVTWEYTGYNMLIIYAALQALPRDLFEAARLDGATDWKVATRVKIPLVFPALVLTGIFSIIGTLQLFSEPQVMRALSGTITSTYTPNLMAYTQAFTFDNPNYAAAIAVLLAVGTFILSFGFLKFTQRRAAAAAA